MTFQAVFLPVFRRTFAPNHPAATGPTTLFYDTFTDTNDTALTAHTPTTDTVGGGWVNIGGIDTQVNEIISNTARVAGLGAASTYTDVNDANVTLQADFTFATLDTNNNLCQFVLRMSDSNNTWRCSVGYISGTGNTYRITDFIAGVSTVRASGDASGLTTTTYSVEATANGSTIDFDWNSLNISYSSATFNQTAERMGIRNIQAGNVNNGYIDNFRILSS